MDIFYASRFVYLFKLCFGAPITRLGLHQDSCGSDWVSFSSEKTGRLQFWEGFISPAVYRPRKVMRWCSMYRLDIISSATVLSVAVDHRRCHSRLSSDFSTGWDFNPIFHEISSIDWFYSVVWEHESSRKHQF